MESVPGWKHSVPASMSWYQGQNPFNYHRHSYLEDNRKGTSNKRKAPFIDDSLLPSKQYVSEEAMAAHLNQLHIGKHFFQPQVDESTLNDAASLTTSELESRLQDDLENSSLLPKSNGNQSQLFISPEVASIQPEPILPKSIIDQLRKPSMELVLWKPPVGLVDSLIRKELAKDDPKDQNANEKSHQKLSDSVRAYCDKKDTSMHKPRFQVVQVVPAMTPMEIENFEEEMNII